MKKTLLIITSLVLMCIMLMGCTESNVAISTSKDLNKNLTILSNTVNRLDTVDNSYLINEDLYAVNETMANKTSLSNEKFSNITRLATSNSVIIENNTDNTNTIKSNLTDTVTKEIINRLYCDENGNCKLCKNTFNCDEDGICNSCNETIICDENGNCKTCNESLVINSNNSCSNCDNTCTSTDPQLVTDSIKNGLCKISSDNTELTATKLNNSISNENNDNFTNKELNNTKQQSLIVSDINNTLNDSNTVENNNNNSISNDNNAKETTDKNYTNINTNNENTNNSIIENNKNTDTRNTNSIIKIIYYTSEDFSPESIRYTPRHISTINHEAASQQLENYINKVQKLYTMTADVVEANNALGDKKSIILDSITETRKLNNCILNGNCTPNENQIDALKVYINEMKNTIKNIRECNGELTNEINKISNTNNGLSQSIDVINSNYLKILNQLDTRISYHENAIATLEQIKYLLEETTNNQPNVENNDSPVIDNTVISNEDNNTISPDNINDNIVDNDEEIINENTTAVSPITDNNHTETNEKLSNNDSNNDDNEDILDTVNTDTTNNEDNNTETNNLETIEDTTTDNTELNNETNTIDDNENTNETTDNIEESGNLKLDETTESESNEDSHNNFLNTNIDSYSTPSLNVSNTDSLNNSNATDTAIDNNINTLEYIEDSNEVINNTDYNKPTMVDTNNTTLYNNSRYSNSIISDNNIGENDIGNSSYRYDENGKLYNNTNGFNTNADYNINNKNNNVNTYKYNTMVDTINRGTVNNGINTL